MAVEKPNWIENSKIQIQVDRLSNEFVILERYASQSIRFDWTYWKSNEITHSAASRQFNGETLDRRNDY